MSSSPISYILLAFLLLWLHSCDSAAPALENQYEVEALYHPWVLTSFMGSNGNMPKVPSVTEMPGLYTIEFWPQRNVLRGHVDCNSYNGNHEATSAGSMHLDIHGVTEAACPQNDVENLIAPQAFLDGLGAVKAYEMDYGKLRLQFGTEGYMTFDSTKISLFTGPPS